MTTLIFNHNDKIHFLATISNKLGNFDMDQFDGRLIFQKTVYFLQAFKINLGYYFNLYLHGPYSPSLTKDGFELKGIIKQITEEVKFPDGESRENFNKFLSFISNVKDKPDELEVLASLHLFKNLFVKENREQIIKRLLEQKRYLSKETCESGWEKLAGFNLV